ncbi:thiol protease/hemagglutinin PrtT [Parabacteroides sp. AM08-6]|uniref:thiol protease/hemagglutinin PrtT n=1 Tax=Parabacteroides sp. AM08-6 TaxID=2292053 RepID=UPI000EFFBE5E|nr:thiol protease/hemagglutinin PrtT [Parabacteroides sp. AM08-6]RHJ84357.1 T9SS C-terminal target domain-containing protein [Parabacteroides sp. AM08-6]
MKRFSTALFLLLLATSLGAAPISVQQAQNAATRFLNSNFSRTKAPASQLNLVWSDAGMETKSGTVIKEATFYVFNVSEGNGFIVVSGDDDVYPILGYSTRQSFQTTSIPSNVKAWFEGYQQQINWIREAKPAVSPATKDAWTALERGDLLLKSQSNLLNTALWNQTAPYNNLCPTVSGEKTPTGCVATALAIVMRYHEWPDVGEGSHSYTTQTYQLPLSATFNTNYDWINMPLSYVSGQYTDQEASNVATLMYDCGVMSDMDYAPDNSGALTITAAQGLVNYMKYDKSLQVLLRELYTEDEWDEIMKNEIDNNRPVVYGGENDQKEGHQFVLDGYNADNYYHINWGWGGLANGYFLLDVLNPEQQGTGGNSGGGFSIGQNAIIGLKKAESSSLYQDILGYQAGEDGGVQYNGISTDDPIVANSNFTVSFGIIFNFSIREFNGDIAVALVDNNDNIKEIISDIESTSIPIYYGIAGSIPCLISGPLSPDDKLCAVFRSSDATDWQKIRNGSDTAGEIEVSDPTTNETIEQEKAVSVIYTATGNVEISSPVEILAISIYDMDGRLLKKQQANNDFTISLPIGTSGKGVYIIEVSTAKGTSTHKVIKNK